MTDIVGVIHRPRLEVCLEAVRTPTPLRETSGPTSLSMGPVEDGQWLMRSGTEVTGVPPPVLAEEDGTLAPERKLFVRGAASTDPDTSPEMGFRDKDRTNGWWMRYSGSGTVWIMSGPANGGIRAVWGNSLQSGGNGPSIDLAQTAKGRANIRPSRFETETGLGSAAEHVPAMFVQQAESARWSAEGYQVTRGMSEFGATPPASQPGAIPDVPTGQSADAAANADAINAILAVLRARGTIAT